MHSGSPVSVDGAFQDAMKRFQAAGVDSARIDARLLLGFVLGGGAEQVLAQSGRDLTEAEAGQMETLVQRREAREPISHILGTREFWSLPFKVTAATLTPRPDTETIVEAALEGIAEPPQRVLDLGTGSGCILLALLSEWKDAEGLGVDASLEALNVAKENATTLGFAKRARFVLGDWNQAHWTRDLGGPFDVVVSNPPYILDGDVAKLDADVRDFEPRRALVGGADGLGAYRAIIKGLPELLMPGGLVVFEVGVNQAEDVANLLMERNFSRIEQRRDLAGIQRAVMARQT